MKRRVSLASALLLLLLAAGCVEVPSCGFGVDFSPDGKRVATTWMNKDRPVLAICNTDGSGFRIVPNSANSGPPKWSPDGRYLLFTTDRDLCLYDLGEKRLNRLAKQVVSGGYVWSHDGSQVACIRQRGENEDEAVWLSVPDGQVLMRVDVQSCAGMYLPDMSIAWIPDSWGIVYLSRDGDVYTVEAGRVYRITHTGGVVSVRVSADGKQLWWVRTVGQQPSALVVHRYDLHTRTLVGTPIRIPVNAINVGGRRLPPDSVYGLLSPDLQRLVVYTSFGSKETRPTPGAKQVCRTDLYDLANLRPRTLMQKQSQSGELPLVVPSWSRNGGQLALLVLGSDGLSLWIGRGDGSGGRVVRHVTSPQRQSPTVRHQ